MRHPVGGEVVRGIGRGIEIGVGIGTGDGRGRAGGHRPETGGRRAPCTGRASRRAGTAALAAFGALVGTLAGAGGAAADARGMRYDHVERPAPGVTFGNFTVTAARRTVHGHLLTVRLVTRGLGVDLLTPGAVAGRATVSRLADARHAVAAVNGDFFDISEEQHPGVAATGSADGPEIASGRVLKAAVPDAQRFGPALPPGATSRDVLGVGTDHRARLDRLTFDGSVRTSRAAYPLRGYNQFALPGNGIGAYTADWGARSRRRAVCGSDTSRAAGCSADTYEVAVRGQRVVSVAPQPGAGRIPAGTTVLLGRDAGADALRSALRVGDRVQVSGRLVRAPSGIRYTFAVGGVPVLRNGRPLAGLDTTTAATRTAAGFGGGGATLYLLALDGGAESHAGLTLAELAAVLRRIGADNAVNLDGGGSSTLVTRARGRRSAAVRNHPSGGAERPVANAIGILAPR
ncbi:phosphodiester glycosidase family protein [Streptomyces sp. NBC_01190]|uniref:phosphodiester glycosidase family protein n=1 Tax=Streptomyces sp. NBC_01190 TaxID=2903767 RepID=UPI00386AB1EA|nr:phosphodiester glycosidase family protein [Streptomyces sp. NBC_01190]